MGHANSTCILFIAFSSLNHVLGTRFVTGDYASFGSKFFLFVNNELFLLYIDNVWKWLFMNFVFTTLKKIVYDKK